MRMKLGLVSVTTTVVAAVLGNDDDDVWLRAQSCGSSFEEGRV